MRLGISLLVIILVLSNDNGALMGMSLAMLTDPILMGIIILWSIIATSAINQALKINTNKILKELIVLISFAITSLLIALIFNVIFINPYLESIGREPSNNAVRAIFVFAISYLLSGIGDLLPKETLNNKLASTEEQKEEIEKAKQDNEDN